jgi:hypothetical protein
VDKKEAEGLAQTATSLRSKDAMRFVPNGKLEKSAGLVECPEAPAASVEHKLTPLPSYWEIDCSLGVWTKFCKFVNMLVIKDGFDDNWSHLSRLVIIQRD